MAYETHVSPQISTFPLLTAQSLGYYPRIATGNVLHSRASPRKRRFNLFSLCFHICRRSGRYTHISSRQVPICLLAGSDAEGSPSASKRPLIRRQTWNGLLCVRMAESVSPVLIKIILTENCVEVMRNPQTWAHNYNIGRKLAPVITSISGNIKDPWRIAFPRRGFRWGNLLSGRSCPFWLRLEHWKSIRARHAHEYTFRCSMKQSKLRRKLLQDESYLKK